VPGEPSFCVSLDVHQPTLALRSHKMFVSYESESKQPGNMGAVRLVESVESVFIRG
jgi:hypothetical protein